MRGIPIFTFINKLDRVGKEPFDLLDEIESTLGIETYPMNWPIGMGQNFSGLLTEKNGRLSRSVMKKTLCISMKNMN